MKNDYSFLYSEKVELEKLLANISKQEVIQRRSLESRLKKVNEELQNFDTKVSIPKASLTFRGDPVDGIKSIAADFAGDAIGGRVNSTPFLPGKQNEFPCKGGR